MKFLPRLIRIVFFTFIIFAASFVVRLLALGIGGNQPSIFDFVAVFLIYAFNLPLYLQQNFSGFSDNVINIMQWIYCLLIATAIEFWFWRSKVGKT